MYYNVYSKELAAFETQNMRAQNLETRVWQSQSFPETQNPALKKGTRSALSISH